MNLPPSAAAPAPSSSAPRRNWPHLLANAAVTLVVLAVAAGTFVLSYAGVHAIALQAGVSVQLARIYPGLFDAVLVIACVAAVVLRDGRWWARCWAWLVVIVVLGAIGATDVLHAMNYALRHRLTEGVVAAAPVVAVLLAFSLLLTMLRQTRSQASGPVQVNPAQVNAAQVDGVQVDAVQVVAAGAVPRPPALLPRLPAPPSALPPAPAAEAADEPDAYADQAPEVSEAPSVASPGIAETQVMPAYSGDAGEAAEAGQVLPDPGAAPTREEAALSATAPAAPEAVETLDAPETSDTSTVADTSDAADPSNAAADSPAVDEQNPPTEPTASRPAPQAIRYASSAVSESVAENWESEVDPDLAGQVYPVLTSDPDIDTSGYPTSEPEDVETDAPPFATAPFASVPRLNRMRVTPIPPTDSGDED